ncbi:signal-induced proliferation-associated 1-like protein 3 isoform X2 [Crotalus tigris]|uniref:signal-induced proliferation-associated 1-like protein 3 isoform X2 n=1 Tax=Crotalus tigris TaxID=88082 RepID=UPI00192FA382|nr:signal-induced proliferation-associated 1-like protein 3 isoform X2 [Crotalus tigris]
MTAYRPVHESCDVGGLDPTGGDYSSPGSWAQNGCTPHVDDASPLRPATTTPAVPKMGVRARIADWPPKREGLKDPATPSAAKAPEAPCPMQWEFQNGQLPKEAAFPSGPRASRRLARRRSKDTEFQDGWPCSPSRAFLALRNRSSSEVTLSECDLETVMEPRGARLAGGLPLFREYGSTSSIDVQGLSEQTFYEMLKEFQSGKLVAGQRQRQRLVDSFHTARSAKAEARAEPELPLQPKEKPRKKGLRGEGSGGDSIFRKLRSGRAEGECSRAPGEVEEVGRGWLCPKSLAHYDVQSLLFDLNEVVAARRVCVAQRKNTTTGASAASAGSAAATCGLANLDPQSTFFSPEDLNSKENLEHDPGDNNSNSLLLSCPHFRNEIGGEGERNISFSPASVGSCGEGAFAEMAPAPYCTNASISVLETPQELQRSLSRLKHYSIEHVDLGARYYRDYFSGKEHFNYFGVDEKLGPVAISIRREKLEDHRDFGPQYQYRIIFRTSELTTLRGAILEDATPTTTKHGTVRGIPLKDVLEHVVPELNTHCLRLALSVPQVSEQLRKLDEQGLCRKHKVGILYCKAGQSSEEEMYNNEEAGPAFEEFLALLGEKVCLRGFGKYAAQLDTKTDSTGTHSLYTTYQGYEIMFHVSTMLPYTPNNRQQLLRKRHIGNDIVTIIFQEPGALPFTPQNVRSHFQHVFIIVCAQNPCTESVCYSVAVTRSKDVPPFGPTIPSQAAFHKSDVFRDFLLAKVINAENAAHKSDKFHTMATRTRHEYLKDLAENSVTSTPIDSSGKFNLISLASKKREKTRGAGAEQQSAGAIVWRVLAQDYLQGMETECLLGISNEFVVLLDLTTKEVVFNCFCVDVIGWTPDSCNLKIFYGRGDHIFVRAPENNPEDVKEIVQRLKVMTSGAETVEMTLRRNGLGQLGFHVKFDGTVAEVEDYGFAWQAGLRQGSRLVEICKVAVVTLSHDQMVDWLRTSVTVKVVVIPPHEDGVPRRGWAESLKMSLMEPRGEPESLPGGYRPPYRNSAWQWSGSATHSSSQPPKWAEQPGPGQSQSLTRTPKQSALTPYRQAQPLHGKRPASFPETPRVAPSSQSGTEKTQPYRQPSGSFSVPGSSGGPFAWYKLSPDNSVHRYVVPLRPPGPFEPLCPSEATSNGDSSSSGGGLASQEGTVERPKPELLWHMPGHSGFSAASGNKRPGQWELPGKDFPEQPPKTSSSNTLSSTASSSAHSDDPADPADSAAERWAKGGVSSNGGIDASSATSIRRDRVPVSSPLFGPALPEGHGKRAEAAWPAGHLGRRSWNYCPRAFGRGVGGPTRGGNNSTPEPFWQASPGASRATYPIQVYKTPPADSSRAAPGSQSSSQLSASVPKSFFSRQSGRSTRPLPAGWKKSPEASARPAPFAEPQKQVDLSTKNVFGQPRLRASLRDLRSPRKAYKSTIEDDLKKLIIMDSAGLEQEDELTPQKTLQRTLSDESLCSGRRDPSFASSACFEQPLSSDMLFTSTLPVRKPASSGRGCSLEKGESGGAPLPDAATISASELSLTEVRDQPLRRLDPALMPLPDTAAGLEWSSLVSAAKAYEVQRAVSLFSLHETMLSPDVQSAGNPSLGHLSLERQPAPHTAPVLSQQRPPDDLTGKVYQLEAMLKQLHSDLQKEKQDKVVLQAEVATLRQNNQRLQEESQHANQRLRKFAEIFSSAVDKEEL